MSYFKAYYLDSVHVGLLWLSLLLTPGLHTQCSDNIILRTFLLFNCLNRFLWSTHRIPITIPGLLKENVYSAASQSINALVFMSSWSLHIFAWLFISATERCAKTETISCVGSCLELHHLGGWGRRIIHDSEAVLIDITGSFPAWDTRWVLLKKATNKTSEFPDVILGFSIPANSYALHIGFMCVVGCISSAPSYWPIAWFQCSELSPGSIISPWKSVSSQNSMAIPIYLWLGFHR